SKEPINSHYTRKLFDALKTSPFRRNFKVIVGGTGAWQIINTDAFEELDIDCVVEGRSESREVLTLFRCAIAGEGLPRTMSVSHPVERDAILTPEKRTTYGAIEMTTGCGRRCSFCAPDLNPQLDVPKEKIMSAVRGTVRDGGSR